EISSGQWKHTNLGAGDALLATYDGNGLHYHLADWLGTNRVQTDRHGNIEETCTNQPFGDNQQCSNSSLEATEQHFTGKERDTESGLDFFGARYYAGGMGRFMNPDWADKPEAVPYATLTKPQTLNLYAYVGNSPIGRADRDGHIYNGSAESGGDPDSGRYQKMLQDDRDAAERGFNGFMAAVASTREAAEQHGFDEQNPQPGTPINTQYVLVVENDSGGHTAEVNRDSLGRRIIEYDLRIAPVDKQHPLGGDIADVRDVVISEHLSNPDVVGGPRFPESGTGQFVDGPGSGMTTGGSTDRYFTVMKGKQNLGVVPIVDRHGKHNVDHIILNAKPRTVSLNGTLDKTDVQ
ncbi:MAG TPA: RHS repeat-associated core domain-containing protein, partial [Acidobacteriaceae bacterium]